MLLLGRVLPGPSHSSLLFHRDLVEGSLLSCRDTAEPLPTPRSPPKPVAPCKRQRAQSPASWPVSGQSQGRRIPAPPPGKAPPCTARKSPCKPGDRLETEPGTAQTSVFRVSGQAWASSPLAGTAAGPGTAAGAGAPLASPSERQLPAVG